MQSTEILQQLLDRYHKRSQFDDDPSQPIARVHCRQTKTTCLIHVLSL